MWKIILHIPVSVSKKIIKIIRQHIHRTDFLFPQKEQSGKSTRRAGPPAGLIDSCLYFLSQFLCRLAMGKHRTCLTL